MTTFEEDRQHFFDLFNKVGDPSYGPMIKKWYESLASSSEIIPEPKIWAETAHYGKADISPHLTLFVTGQHLGLHLDLVGASVAVTTPKDLASLKKLIALLEDVTAYCLGVVDEACKSGLEIDTRAFNISDQELLDGVLLDVILIDDEQRERMDRMFYGRQYLLLDWWLAQNQDVLSPLEKEFQKQLTEKQEAAKKRLAEKEAAEKKKKKAAAKKEAVT